MMLLLLFQLEDITSYTKWKFKDMFIMMMRKISLVLIERLRERTKFTEKSKRKSSQLLANINT